MEKSPKPLKSKKWGGLHPVYEIVVNMFMEELISRIDDKLIAERINKSKNPEELTDLYLTNALIKMASPSTIDVIRKKLSEDTLVTEINEYLLSEIVKKPKESARKIEPAQKTVEGIIFEEEKELEELNREDIIRRKIFVGGLLCVCLSIFLSMTAIAITYSSRRNLENKVQAYNKEEHQVVNSKKISSDKSKENYQMQPFPQPPAQQKILEDKVKTDSFPYSPKKTKLLYSSDGGKTFETLLAVENIPTLSIKQIDNIIIKNNKEITVYLKGHVNEAIETSDGGKSWEHVVYHGRHYGSRSVSYITHDRGKTWEKEVKKLN